MAEGNVALSSVKCFDCGTVMEERGQDLYCPCCKLSAPPKLDAPTLGAFGYVLPHEEREAKELIDKQFIDLTGKPFGAKVCGYLIAIKIYVRPDHIKVVKRDDGTEGKIYIPEQSQAEDRFQSVAGLVVGIGPQAYKGKNADGSERFPEGKWCSVGDWVTIPRYEAHLFSYRGVALGIIPDDKIMSVIEDPTDVQNINAAIKY